MLSNTELLLPRYECIAPYPNSPFKVGEVITPNTGGYIGCQEAYDKYPNVFRKMQWNEKREIKDMPEYVKINGKIWHVKKWIPDTAYLKPIVYIAENEKTSFAIEWHFHWKESTPATEEDYLNFIQQNTRLKQ